MIVHNQPDYNHDFFVYNNLDSSRYLSLNFDEKYVVVIRATMDQQLLIDQARNETRPKQRFCHRLEVLYQKWKSSYSFRNRYANNNEVPPI